MEASRSIAVFNRQRRVKIDLARVRRFAETALLAVEEKGVAATEALARVEEVEVTILSDRAIDGVHRRFMNIAGATDVITFDHGEIVISAETAAREAGNYGHTLEGELGLYIIHGLLHLNGFDDREPEAAARMHACQAALHRKCLERLG